MNSIRIKDRMSSPVETVAVDKTVIEAASLMVRKDIGSLLITFGDNQRAMITERDIVKAVADGNTQMDLSEFTTNPLITINENSYLGDAAQMMLTRKIRRLVAVDDEGKISGIINMRDITTAVHDSFLALFEVA